MAPALSDIIRQFRMAQDRAVAFLVDVLGPELGLRLPASNREWVSICGEFGLTRRQRINGVGIYTHGYGIELIFDGLTIDFDWGDSGEPDGFDAWRLENFCRLNKIKIVRRDHSQIQGWLDEATAVGELIKDTLLYYDPTNRASPSRR